MIVMKYNGSDRCAARVSGNEGFVRGSALSHLSSACGRLCFNAGINAAAILVMMYGTGYCLCGTGGRKLLHHFK